MTKRSTSSRSSGRSTSRGRSSSGRRTTRKKPRESLWNRLSNDQKLDIVGWVLFFLALLTILSFVSAQQGALTEWWISVLAQTFGWGMYVVPLFFGGLGLWLILRRFEERLPKIDPEQIVGVVGGFFIALMTLHLITSFVWPQLSFYRLGEVGVGGGLIGALMLDVSVKALGKAGTTILLILAWLVIVTFIAGISPADAVRLLAERAAARQAGAAGRPAVGCGATIAPARYEGDYRPTRRSEDPRRYSRHSAVPGCTRDGRNRTMSYVSTSPPGLRTATATAASSSSTSLWRSGRNPGACQASSMCWRKAASNTTAKT